MKETTAKGNPLARGERLQIMLDGDELLAVDDFRFTHRMASRASAVRVLLKRGLEVEGIVAGTPAAKAQPFGAVRPSASKQAKSG